MTEAPPMKIVCRTANATQHFSGPASVVKMGELQSGPSIIACFAEDGGMLCTTGPKNVDLFNTQTMEQVRSLPICDTLFVAFSPRSTYLVTCGRPMKGIGESNNNLQVWEVSTGQKLWEFHQRSVSDESWPALHWQDDEQLVFRMVANTIHAYEPAANFQSIVCKLPLPGVAGYSVSPGQKPKIAAYVGEAKGQPATVGVYPVANLPRDKTSKPQATNRKSFYRVTGVTFLWNSSGSTVLCNSYADVDATNKSYYGEQHLHYLDATKEDSCQVPNLEKGPIHDVQWSPNGEYFVVVAGFMPAKTLLFNSQCKPIFDFGSGPHNLIRWSPHGRFLSIAGFGNLPGDIVFWEKKANGSCKKISSVRCPSVTLEWSPCSRYVLTAITAPRLRVDNNFKVLTYFGEQVHEHSFEELYEAKWVPIPSDLFPDRPVSPTVRKSGTNGEQPKKESQQSAYVPPHLRGKSTKASGPQFSLGHSEDQGGRIKSTPQKQEAGVPGASFLSKSALKNARRKAKKAASETSEEQGASSNKPSPAAPKHVEKPANEVSMPATEGKNELTETEKRIRKLKKQLRQLEDLQNKRKDGNTELTEEQLQKLASRAGLLRELKELETRP